MGCNSCRRNQYIGGKTGRIQLYSGVALVHGYSKTQTKVDFVLEGGSKTRVYLLESIEYRNYIKYLFVSPVQGAARFRGLLYHSYSIEILMVKKVTDQFHGRSCRRLVLRTYHVHHVVMMMHHASDRYHVVRHDTLSSHL
jgi:hypothetical protein